jgi:hypothetical protein
MLETDVSLVGHEQRRPNEGDTVGVAAFQTEKRRAASAA